MPMPGSYLHLPTPGWATDQLVFVLHGLLVLALWKTLWALHHARPKQRALRLALVALALLGTAAWLTLFGPGDIRDGWLTPLQESGSLGHVRQFTGHGAHAEFVYSALVNLFVQAGGPLEGLHAVIWMNLWWTFLSTVLFLGIAVHMLERYWLALTMTAFFVGNRFAVNGALAETPGAYLSTLFLLGVLGMGVATRPSSAPRQRRWGLGLAAAATLLAAGTRPETTGYALIAALVMVPPRVAPGFCRKVGAGLEPLWQRARPRGTSGALWAVLVVLLILAVDLWLAGQLGRFQLGRIGWLVQGLVLAPLSLLGMPSLLAWGWLPWPIFILAVLGSAHSMGRLRLYGGIGISSFLMLSIYMAAAHDERYEHLRYGGMVVPAFMLLALIGLQDVDRRWRRLAQHRWPALLGLLGLAAALGVLSLRIPHDYVVEQNQQREVRSLASLIRKHPRCLIAVPVNASGIDPGSPYRSAIVLLSRDLPAPFMWEGPHGPGDRAFRHRLAEWQPQVARHDCVLNYRSLDCNLQRASCGDGDARPVWQWRYENRPYTTHSGEHSDHILLQASRLP